MAVAVIILDLCVMSVLKSYSGIIQRGYLKETMQVVKHDSLSFLSEYSDKIWTASF